MEPSHNHKFSPYFIKTGLIFLLIALLFGLAGALEYIIPGLWRNSFSFEKIRPLHVSAALFWILISATGSLLYFLREYANKPLRFHKWIKWSYLAFASLFFLILISYFFGVFGGREYWEFHPLFAIPLVLSWCLFALLVLSNLKTLKNQPVYIWMWLTGTLFFLFTYVESNLWLIPEIRNHLVKDMTIQWKSYGSLVGSWNMLIYGSSIYLMDKIAGNQKYAYSNMAFGLFFLGLFNLMFNWGHHVYTLPTQAYVKHIGYLVSMTELFILGRIIYLWKASLSDAKKNFHIHAYRFIFAADVWVFLTLGLAIAMSVPALNVFMHGTHVVVAHTMGATIGINSMLLLAFAFYILKKNQINDQKMKRAYMLIQGSLLFFWLALIIAGFLKSYWQFNEPDIAYGEMIKSLRPWFFAFFISGLGLIAGLCIIVFELLKRENKTAGV